MGASVTVKTESQTTARAVLIVDDDALYRRSLGRALRGKGYRPVDAEGVNDALAKIAEEPDVAFAVVDYHLAEGSGLEVIRALRAARDDLRCVMLSAFCSTVVAVEAMRVGALDCIPKSSSLDWITAELQRPADDAAPVDDAIPYPSLAQVEWDHIQRVLRDCNGNVSHAARKLGIHRQSLQRKIRRFAPMK
jgi:two-component system response regulator RegA